MYPQLAAAGEALKASALRVQVLLPCYLRSGSALGCIGEHKRIYTGGLLQRRDRRDDNICTVPNYDFVNDYAFPGIFFTLLGPQLFVIKGEAATSPSRSP